MEEKITKVVETKVVETKVVEAKEENLMVVRAGGKTKIRTKTKEKKTKTKRTRLYQLWGSKITMSSIVLSVGTPNISQEIVRRQDHSVALYIKVPRVMIDWHIIFGAKPITCQWHPDHHQKRERKKILLELKTTMQTQGQAPRT